LRLTHIKLAGFKSFVDPTVIPVPAQLTGVVGPNGCGKSNVIDAVRWVLGESSAKHLRGESMQDVIFNGSGTRKPASRASVELAFNNELGRAAGQWSQYAEISVKRVLDRSGDSTYYINNMRVRRRDVADLFLGTGVGARAYAIIEQGMISRLIEAKPEELRGYLEEAAGVSKYKERRKETEARLKDARDNMNRVEDIQRELKNQVEKLAAQAEVAQHYRSLQADLTFAQHRLWFARKHDAAQQRARIDKDLVEAQNRLEAETARLRHIESELETARQTQFAGQDTLNTAQAAYYQAQSEVARIEQTMAHQNATRERLYRQVQDLGARMESQQARRTGTREALDEVSGQQPGLEAALMASRARPPTVRCRRKKLRCARRSRVWGTHSAWCRNWISRARSTKTASATPSASSNNWMCASAASPRSRRSCRARMRQASPRNRPMSRSWPRYWPLRRPA